MADRIFPERCYHFLNIRDGLFDPWRWGKMRSWDKEMNVVIVNDELPKSITIPHISSRPPTYGTLRVQEYRVAVVNRGQPLTFLHSDNQNQFPHTIEKDGGAVITARQLDVLINTSDIYGLGDFFFRMDHFDMTPRVLSDHIHSDNDRLHGIIAFSCDWEGTKTVELWVDGTTKLVKFQNIASGQHVLEYSIPGPVVKGWSRAATRMVPLELRTEFRGYERILWSGATLAVKTAVPQG